MQDVLKPTSGMSTLELLVASAIMTSALGAVAAMLFGAQDTLRAAAKDIDQVLRVSVLPPQVPQQYGCEQLASRDWSHPLHYDYPTATLGTSSGMEITGMQVQNNLLYMSSRTSTTNNTLNIFSLSTPTAPPTYLGGVDNNPSIVSAGLTSIAVRGEYVYAASGYGANFTSCAEAANCAQLQIFDTHDPAHPTLTTNRKVPGVSGASGQGAGSTILYRGGYVYLGLTKQVVVLNLLFLMSVQTEAHSQTLCGSGGLSSDEPLTP